MSETSIAKFLAQEVPDPGWAPHLLALWFDGRGHWDRAHSLVDQVGGIEAARVHAYLHRKEGDLWNADYWYRRAGEERFEGSLEAEWRWLVREFYG